MLLGAGASRTIKDDFGRVPADYATKARIKAMLAQSYPWQNEHELAAAFAGLPPSKPAGTLALRLVRSLPRL